MRLFWRPGLVLFSVVLLGCATGAQLEVQRQNKVLAETTAVSADCFGKIAADPQYAALNSKTALNTDNISLEMLSDNSKPTREMVQLLYKCMPISRGPEKLCSTGPPVRIH
jgi:hypothetical protein